MGWRRVCFRVEMVTWQDLVFSGMWAFRILRPHESITVDSALDIFLLGLSQTLDLRKASQVENQAQPCSFILFYTPAKSVRQLCVILE